jgi:hypothetical protein
MYISEIESKTGLSMQDDNYLFHSRKGGGVFTGGGVSKQIEDELKKYTFENLSAHGLRKFFQSALESAGENMNIITHYLGKVIGDSTRSYSKHNSFELLEKYRKNYSYLALGEIIPYKARLEIENERLRIEMQKNIDKEEENKALLEKVQTMYNYVEAHFDLTPESDKYLVKQEEIPPKIEEKKNTGKPQNCVCVLKTYCESAGKDFKCIVE